MIVFAIIGPSTRITGEMDNLPILLGQSMDTLLRTKELSSWTFHEGKQITLTLRFKDEQPSVDDDGKPTRKHYIQKNKSRQNRDDSRYNDKHGHNTRLSSKFKLDKNSMEKPRSADDSSAECFAHSILSPEAVAFSPQAGSPVCGLLQEYCSPSACSDSVTGVRQSSSVSPDSELQSHPIPMPVMDSDSHPKQSLATNMNNVTLELRYETAMLKAGRQARENKTPTSTEIACHNCKSTLAHTENPENWSPPSSNKALWPSNYLYRKRKLKDYGFVWFCRLECEQSFKNVKIPKT